MNITAPRPQPGDEPLAIWTVYDHPVDFPDAYVARQSFVGPQGMISYGSCVLTPRIEWLRRWLLDRGLSRLERMPQDGDPKIVEVWI